MTGPNNARLSRLVTLAALIRDQRQAELTRCAAACAQTRALIADLAAPLPGDSDLPLQVLQEAALRHTIWSGPQRIRLNEQLARQRAAEITAEAALRDAFGRAVALERLAAKAGSH